jgi:hypothetical protein
MGFFRRAAPSWSPLETQYLQEHRKDLEVKGKRDEATNQLCLILGKSRNALKKKLDEMDGKTVEKGPGKKRTNIGRRKDLGCFFRSSWEANFARYLNYKNIKWTYEPKVFIFPGVKKGTISYAPDFYLPDLDLWVEIKGQLIPQARTALSRMKKFFPEDFKKIRCVPGSDKTTAAKYYAQAGVETFAYYNSLNKEYKKVIENWE